MSNKELLDKYIQNNKTDIEKALLLAFEEISNDLLESKIDTNCSGTTANIVLMDGNRLYNANLGDSRAMFGSMKEKELIARDISTDQKPDDEKEKLRIEASGGRVGPILDSKGNAYGPCRVWMKTQDIPGLAMSRSLGDKYGRKAGVISIPGKGNLKRNKSFRYEVK